MITEAICSRHEDTSWIMQASWKTSDSIQDSL